LSVDPTEGLESASDDLLRAAIERIRSGESLAEAERAIASVAPELRTLLAEALDSGGWFGEPHEAETLKVATMPDEQARIEALRSLLTEETNIGMLVGVAVGWALRAELIEDPGSEEDGPDDHEDPAPEEDD
jgi:hypothetical protein